MFAPREHHYTYSRSGRTRHYPWSHMAPGDYLIDRDAVVGCANSKGTWWEKSNAYTAAKAYERRHPTIARGDNSRPFFTGRVERDPSSGKPIGVRVTRELGPFMRTNDSMWAALREIITNDDEFDALAKRLHRRQPRSAKRAILRAELERRLPVHDHPLL